MGRSRYKTVADGKTYFASSAIINWTPIFAIPELAKIILDSMIFLHTNQRITIHAYVLMENHFHLIGSSSDFSGEIRKMKSFTARNIVDHMEKHGPDFFLEQFMFFKKRHKNDQEYQVWQEGFHPKGILNDKMLNQKLDYVHYNPVRRGIGRLFIVAVHSPQRQQVAPTGLYVFFSLRAINRPSLTGL